MESPRRVLAPLDANANMAVASTASALPLSPPATIEPKKRALEATSDSPNAVLAVEETPSKRACLPATGSFSPATPSVFDLPANIRTSQGTSTTQRDAASHHASASRERSRQRAEILKLRLGLARYKVRTGQVNVPLEQLRIVPAATQRYILEGRQQSTRLLLPPYTPQRRWQQPERRRQEEEEDNDDDDDIEYAHDEDADDKVDEAELPQQPRRQLDLVEAVDDRAASPTTGGRGDREEEEDDGLPQLPHIRPADANPSLKPTPRLLTTPRGNRQLIEPTIVSTSAMRDGTAVSGLLSLARS